MHETPAPIHTLLPNMETTLEKIPCITLLYDCMIGDIT